MSYDPRGRAPQNRRISPETGESSSERPAPRAFEDVEVAQVAESFGNPGILTTTHSRGQGYGLPPATTSSYQSTTETANILFSAESDSTIISLVAAGWTFERIKNEYFPHQDNVTPWLLECRAQTLDAFWKEQEDKRLSEIELGHREPREVLRPSRDEYFSDPRREVRDIQVRYNLSNDFGQEYTPMTFGNKNSEIMLASGVSEDANTSQHDMGDQDPDQHAYQYQDYHQDQDPGQDPNQYLKEDFDTHRSLVNYQTTGTGGVSESPGDPSLTTSHWGNQLDPSQPAAASQWAVSGGDYNQYPAFLDPSSSSVAQFEQQHIESGQSSPRGDPSFSPGEECWLRIRVACGDPFDLMASGLRRTEESVIAFIKEQDFFWTQEDDDELRESMREDHSLDPEVIGRLVESGKRFEDEIRNRAEALKLWEVAKREAAEASNSRPPQQNPTPGSAPHGPLEPQDSQGGVMEVGTRNKGPHKFWRAHELKALEDYVKDHNSWKDVEDWMPGRSKQACMDKWRHHLRTGFRIRQRRDIEGQIEQMTPEQRLEFGHHFTQA